MAHTKGPWKTKIILGNVFVTPEDYDKNLEERDGRAICELGGNCFEENEANAQFIVRACNSHEELLEACKSAIRMLDDAEWKQQDIDYKAIKRAIAKAEGKE